jgi:hypothetical protein
MCFASVFVWFRLLLFKCLRLELTFRATHLQKCLYFSYFYVNDYYAYFLSTGALIAVYKKHSIKCPDRQALVDYSWATNLLTA